MAVEITFTPEQVFGEWQIEKWGKEGHWPPPVGMRVLPPGGTPDPEAVALLMRNLMMLLPESQRRPLKVSLQQQGYSF